MPFAGKVGGGLREKAFAFGKVIFSNRSAPMDSPSDSKPPLASCPLCGAARFRPRFSFGGNQVVQCAGCRFDFLNPQPSDRDLAEIYGQDYFLGAGEGGQEQAYDRLKRRTAETYLDQLTGYAGFKTGRLLEIGSGGGAMLVAAAHRGFTVTGVEYSDHACRTARQRLAAAGLPGEVVGGEIGRIAGRKAEFDACILADVIEHVRSPAACLQILSEVLRPGGVIFLATPSLDSWSARLMGRRWMEYKTEHLSYFRRSTLARLLRSAGFHSLVAQPGHKILSYDYIQDHFEKFPTPFYSRAVRTLGACLPSSWKTRELRLVASGMVMLGRRGETAPLSSSAPSGPAAGLRD